MQEQLDDKLMNINRGHMEAAVALLSLSLLGYSHALACPSGGTSEDALVWQPAHSALWQAKVLYQPVAV